MTKLEALQRAVREINNIKRVRGYVYGVSDCWTQFTYYDSYVNKLDNLKDKITLYNTPRTFHNRVKDLGYNDYRDMLLKNGYEEIDFSNIQIGDICVASNPIVDYTISVYDGNFWINSSNEPRYEKLPTKYIKKNCMLAARLQERYYAGI